MSSHSWVQLVVHDGVSLLRGPGRAKRRGHRCGTRLIGEAVLSWVEEPLEPQRKDPAADELRVALSTLGGPDRSERDEPVDHPIRWTS